MIGDEEAPKSPLFYGCRIASAIFAVLLCLALFLIVMGDRSELERVEAQAAVFLEQMEQAADSARQSALAGAQDNFENSMPGMPDASSGIQPGSADSASGKSTDETYVPSADDEYYEKITDAIRDDLPYGVEWQECDLSRKQEDASFYALYPKLTGEIRNRDYLKKSSKSRRFFIKITVRCTSNRRALIPAISSALAMSRTWTASI